MSQNPHFRTGNLEGPRKVPPQKGPFRKEMPTRKEHSVGEWLQSIYFSHSVDLSFFSHDTIYNYYSNMAIIKSKRRLENLRWRKKTLLKKVYELRKDYRVDVTLILCQNGRYIIYRSTDLESWPPSMKEIVRQCHPDIHTKVKAASLIPNSQEYASSIYGKTASEFYRSKFLAYLFFYNIID